MTENLESRSIHWLSEYSEDVYSQFGEDGVIRKALETLPETDGWCVEFGAWDGLHLSNTANLIRHHDYSGVLIEADRSRFDVLKANYADNSKVHPLLGYVGWTESDGLDHFLEQTEIPRGFDLLSIDIDGNDFHVWNAVKHYRPKMVIIEFNPTIPSEVDFTQPPDGSRMHGASGLALTRLADQKGYQLIHVSRSNLLFVQKEYASLFGIHTNSFFQMRTDASDVTFLFTGYDGTNFLSGRKMMMWHHLPIHPDDVQVIPSWLRRFPNGYSAWHRLAMRFLRWWKSGTSESSHATSADFI